jgi:hypothetical protein
MMHKVLEGLSEVIGFGPAVHVCQRWSGRKMRVPVRVAEGDPLALALGMETASKLVQHYAGQCLELPTERSALLSLRNAAIASDRAAGASHGAIGANYGLTRQAVAAVLKNHAPHAGGEK